VGDVTWRRITKLSFRLLDFPFPFQRFPICYLTKQQQVNFSSKNNNVHFKKAGVA
jgi:hypothetical protein